MQFAQIIMCTTSSSAAVAVAHCMKNRRLPRFTVTKLKIVMAAWACLHLVVLLLSIILLQVAAQQELFVRRPRLSKRGQDLAICVMVKDHNLDIREWIHYHRSMG
jgi:hypothetical protein